MLIQCPNCQSKARIGSSNAITLTIRDLYCQCSNVKDCGCTFVVSLAFKNYLNPPRQQHPATGRQPDPAFAERAKAGIVAGGFV